MNTITRIAGLSAAVLTLAGAGVATAAAGEQHSTAGTHTVASTSVPALKPGKINYKNVVLCDCDRPDDESSFSLLAPKGWRQAELSRRELQFTGGHGLHRLRVHRLETNKTPAALSDAKLKALRSVSGFKLLFRSTGHANDYRYTTIAYTYRDAHGATRLVFTRWYAAGFTEGRALFETSVAGRTMDKDGLWAVQAKATHSLLFAG